MSDEKPKRVEPYPTEDDRSFGYHAARTTLDAAASLVPGAGYAVGELVKHFIGEPLERRREEWLTSIGEGVAELQDRFDGFNPSSLSDNEEFISAVYETTQHAMKTHRKEKREALRNAVLNIALGYRLDEVERGAFLGAVDRFSPLHIAVLKLLSNPEENPEYVKSVHNIVMGSRDQFIGPAIGLHASDGSLSRVLSDLRREGFTDGSESGGMGGRSLLQKATTRDGDRFIQFISSPAD